MADKTKIEWTDATWSPIRFRVRQDAAAIAEAKGYTSLVQIAGKMAGHVGPHCEKVSPGCVNCWSESNCHRCLPSNGTGLPFDRRSRDLVECFVDEQALKLPLGWKEPRRIFVEYQSDLFGEFVPDAFIDRVVATMVLCPKHSFQVLTKRAKRMLDWIRNAHGRISTLLVSRAAQSVPQWADRVAPAYVAYDGWWPLPNTRLGFSAENQKEFDARWAYMRQLAAAGWLVWCSGEPLLGTINMGQALKEGLRWVVVGGESGPGARPCDLAWIRSIVAQCKAAETACFVKQLGAKPMYPPETILHPPASRIFKPKDRKGGDISGWPKYLHIRQFPKSR